MEADEAVAETPLEAPPSSPRRILCLPAHAERDELAGMMLAQLLRPPAFDAQNASRTLMTGELIDLALAHQGTVQFEAALAKPVGKLVNVAGRQRMLTQRMAKFYLAATLPVDASVAATEIGKARNEFITAMELLRNAPEATLRIKDELLLADAQWIFFDMALQQLQEGAQRPKPMSDIFVSSENLLAVIDRVTGMYSAIKV